MSKAEDKVESWLKRNKVKFQREYKFDDLKGNCDVLRFDFALFHDDGSLAALIEIQGPHHFEPMYGQDAFMLQQEYDRRKDEYCQNHKYPLLHLTAPKNEELKAYFAILKRFVNCHLPELGLAQTKKKYVIGTVQINK